MAGAALEHDGRAAAANQPVRRDCLAMSLLGGVSLSAAGRQVRLKSRKARAVLAYVALSEGLQETRERLVGLLWSGSDEERARGSLRQTLRELRQVFCDCGYGGLWTDKLTVGFDRGSIDVDLWQVMGEAEAGRVHPLLLDAPRVTERLLDGFDDLDPAFRGWVLAKRHTLQERLLRALEAQLRREDGEVGSRSPAAEAIINLDPTHEEACRQLMRAKAEAGDVAGALRVYKTLWDLLDEDYFMEPSPLTQKLVADIKMGAFDAGAAGDEPPRPDHAAPAAPPGLREPPAAPAPRPVTRIELAVEAFGSHGIEPDKVHLVQGFRQHLIACLVRFREWYVTDRSAPPAAGLVLPPVSARYAVQASAYKSADAVNLIVTLKESDTSLYVWSDRSELRIENWFEAQQRIVRRIAMALNVHLSTERLMRLAGEPDVSLEIYDRWLRGQAMILGFSPTGRRRAAEIFREVIRAAPDFSPAYSSLVQMNNTDHIVHPGVFRDRAKERQTLELARTVVQLDPVDSRAQLCLGWAHAMAKQYEQAEVHVELAAQLNENDPWTLISAAQFHAFAGKFDRARALSREALELSPAPSRTHWGYEATNRFLWGDYPGCVDAASHVQDVLSGQPAWTAAALLQLGHRCEAAAEAQRFLGRMRANWYGAPAPGDADIMRWLLHLYPIRRREDWERLRDGLAGAGVPVDGAEHHAW